MSAASPHLVPVYSRARGVLDGDALSVLGGETILGREAPGGESLFAGDTMVSRQHAVLRVSAEPWRIEIVDLESKNGTFVNGRALPSQFLVDGDLVRIGDTFFVFRLLEQVEATERLR